MVMVCLHDLDLALGLSVCSYVLSYNFFIKGATYRSGVGDIIYYYCVTFSTGPPQKPRV